MGVRLQGKRAIVTGASRGIGKAIALAFAKEGAAVVANYYSAAEREEADRLITEIVSMRGKGLAFEANVSEPREVHALVNKSIEFLSGIDILVNNAGICQFSDFVDLPLSVWEQTQAVNHRGVFLCSQAVSKHMIRQNLGGSIISIGSVGAYTGGPSQAHYNASKAAVGSLMRSMAVALGSHRIRCNSILPGCVETHMNQKLLADEEHRTSLESRTPLGRIGVPADLIGAALFFASDESSFCSGSELTVDGGISINI